MNPGWLASLFLGMGQVLKLNVYAPAAQLINEEITRDKIYPHRRNISEWEYFTDAPHILGSWNYVIRNQDILW